MRLVDTHCHLNFKAFHADFLAVAKKSAKKGVERAVIVGSSGSTSARALEVARGINDKLGRMWAYVAVGIHPTHFDDIGSFSLIERLAEDKLVVAIGETGFDLYRMGEDSVPRQKELFDRHIELSKKTGKPLIFHNRNADEVFTTEIKRIQGLRAVFHCFSTDHNFAKLVTDLGFYVSFTAKITYGNKKLKKVIKRTPIGRIMIETDAPYIVPEPQRSEGVERNEPYLVMETAKKIAQIKELEVDFVADKTTKNALDFFAL